MSLRRWWYICVFLVRPEDKLTGMCDLDYNTEAAQVLR